MDEESYQAKVRNTAIPAVYLILLRWDGKILLGLRHNTGYQDGKWELPAGHVEEGELPSEAMVREAKEEIGVGISQSDLLCVHTSYRPVHDRTGNRVDLVFQTNRWFSEPRICEPDKCAELRWFHRADLPEAMVPYAQEFIKCWNSGVPYSEFGVEWLRINGLYKL